jgi:hypothetical protein
MTNHQKYKVGEVYFYKVRTTITHWEKDEIVKKQVEGILGVAEFSFMTYYWLQVVYLTKFIKLSI